MAAVVPTASVRPMTEIPPEYDVRPDERTELAAVAEADADPAVATFKALTDPLRIAVLRMLAVRTLCVCVLVDVLDVEYSKLSYHLKVLRDAGLVEMERDGNFAEYRLTERGEAIAGLLDSVRSERG
jgi:ArsR family transcriptional regulator